MIPTFSRFIVCNHLQFDHDVGRQFFAGQDFHRAFDRGLAHFIRELRDRRGHRPRFDRLLRIVERVEADDANLAGPAGGGDGLDRTERHQIAGGKHRVDVAMRLQHVLEDVEALIALPVRRLATRRWTMPGAFATASRKPRSRESPVSWPGIPSRMPTRAFPPELLTTYSPASLPPS
jgi:hypothetical protein